MKAAALRTVELICFVAALGFMIPPIASDARYPYRATSALIIGGLLFAVSLALSWRRAAENWITAVVKVLAYILLVWIAYERSFIH